MRDYNLDQWLKSSISEISDSYWDFWIKNYAISGKGNPPPFPSEELDVEFEKAIIKRFDILENTK